MSELKADKTFVFGEECEAYKKSEADKVIADKDKEIARLDDLAHAHNLELLQKENCIAELKDKLRHYPMMVALLENDKKKIEELKESHNKEVEQLLMKIAGLEKLVETADKLVKQEGGFTVKDVTFGGVKLEGINTQRSKHD
jgi:chromosome segregation ATPase